jgi:hypothetical protein
MGAVDDGQSERYLLRWGWCQEEYCKSAGYFEGIEGLLMTTRKRVLLIMMTLV